MLEDFGVVSFLRMAEELRFGEGNQGIGKRFHPCHVYKTLRKKAGVFLEPSLIVVFCGSFYMFFF